MEKAELTSLRMDELKALAKKINMALPAKATKGDIVNALLTAGPAKGRKGPAKKSGVSKKPAAKKRSGSKPAEKPAETPSHEWNIPPGVEEPLLARERAAGAKYYTGSVEQGPVSSYDELPEGYGEEKIVLMARDPSVAYTYWEVTQARIEKEKAWLGWDSRLSLRIYDITGIQFDGTNANAYYDQDVSENTGTWYFDLDRPSHSFCADLGLLSPKARFLTLARSNYITMPRDSVSDEIDAEWILMDEEYWKRYGFPGGLSSPEMQEMWRRRHLQEITSPGFFSVGRRKGK
ncbi:MAG TPA: hypothetical protein DCO77_09655 [Nitrospiraceae bacterium]|nr:hypothetical protein [Nitrospiraceae bacterium]